MDFEALLKELKASILGLFGEKWDDLKKDMKPFFNANHFVIWRAE